MIDKLILVGGFLGSGKTTLLAHTDSSLFGRVMETQSEKMCNSRNGAQRNDGSQSRNRKIA